MISDWIFWTCWIKGSFLIISTEPRWGLAMLYFMIAIFGQDYLLKSRRQIKNES